MDDSMFARSLKSVLPPVILIGLMLAVFYGMSPTIRPVPPRDASVYLYSGQQMLKGALPYRDLWDHRPPELFYLNALGLLLGSGSTWGVWALEALFLCAATGLSFAMLRRVFGTLPAFLATFLWVVTLALLYDFDIAEEFGLLFQFAALYFFIRAEERGRYGGYAVALGAAFALSLNLKQNLIGIWIALGLFLIFRAVLTRQVRSTLLILLRMGAGAAIILVPVLVYFAATGLLGEMWNAAYVFNFLYASATWPSRLSALELGVQSLIQSGIVLTAAAGWLVGLGSLWRRSSQNAAVIGLAFIGLPVELWMSTLSGRTYAHYFISALPIMAVLTALLLHQLLKLMALLPSLPLQRLATVLIMAAVFAGAIIPYRAYQSLATGVTYTFDGTRGQTALFIMKNTTPEDYVLVWGAEAMVNSLSNRKTPSRYINNYTLFMPGYQSSALIQEYVAELRRHPPAYIIDTSYANGLFSPIDLPGRRDWIEAKAHDTSIAAGHEDFQPLAAMDLFFDYVARNYRRIGHIKKWYVYQRNDFQPPQSELP